MTLIVGRMREGVETLSVEPRSTVRPLPVRLLCPRGHPYLRHLYL